MSFNVSFGSQQDVRSGDKKTGWGKGPRPDRGDEDSKSKDFHPRGRGGGRGRGGRYHRGHRGGGGGRGGGHQGHGDDAVDDGDDNGDENDSDGASSTSSDTRGRGRRRGRGRGRGGRGRGGKQDDHAEKGSDNPQGPFQHGKGPRPSGRGGRGGERLPRAHSREQISTHAHQENQPSCEHCQHHSHPRTYAAPPPCQPPPPYSSGVPPSPSYAHQPPYNQPPVSQPYSYQQPVSQPYGGMPPMGQPGYTHAPPAPPPFHSASSWPGQGFQSPHSGPPPPPGPPGPHQHGHQPYGQPPYNQYQPHTYTGQPHQPFEGSSGPHHHHTHGSSERGSCQNLNQPHDESASGFKEWSKEKGKRNRGAPNPCGKQPGAENPQQKEKERAPKPQGMKQEQKKPPTESSTSSGVQSIDLGPDEWVKVFNLLLGKFNGRTKFGTLMTQKEDTFQGVGHDKAAQWIKENSSKFLAFEKDGMIKYVSILFRGARLCYNYTKPGTEICRDEKCQYFHICKDYVSGNCPYGAQCSFNHSFHTKANGKICADAGLGMFTDEQIRTIVLRSTPVVCEKFNKTDCVEETCPDLHVCSKNILHDCASGDDCKLGHLIKDTEHNMWVLRTFHVERLPEKVLSKIVIVKKDVPQAASTAKDVPSKTPKASQGDGQEAADKDEKGKKSQNKSRSAMRKARSKETLQPDPVLSVPPTAGKTGGDVDQAAASSLRQRSPEQDAKQDDQRSPSGERPRPVPARRTKVPEVPRAVNPEGGDGQTGFTASQYAHLCENHTWEGKCPRGYLCPRYHHRDRPPFVWQLQAFGDWQDFSKEDSFDIEKQFCQFANQETFEVVLDNIGGLKLSIHFGTLTATVEDAYTSASRISVYQNLQLRRWSTPSYMEAETKAPLNYYTQWCWYFMDTDGHLQPFRPELFQYTLEEKYISGQSKYFYEHGERQLMIHLQEMVQVDLDTGMAVSVFRRPIFHSVITSAPEMSSLLLKEPPAPLSHPPPTHWSKVDLLHDFELVELEKVGSEYQDVLRSFHATLDRSKASILRIFRVQNLNLWDKYCSTKRAMTPRDGSASDVDERRLFHGTPTLLGARGICANNMDFRRSGENVGALYGKGSYFSAHAIYSHSYTQGPHRYMFLAKVLVGKYTAGKPSYMSPPLREGLKLYDSCVNDEANPTIFVIFDLAQSYPEYLIQYEDSGAQGQGLAKTHSLGTLPATASVGTKPQPPERNPHSPHASADPARLLSHPSQNPALEAQSAALHGYYNARTQRSEFVGPERQGTGIEERQRAPYSGLAFDNPYGGSTGAQSVGGARATTQPNLQGRATPMSPPGQRAKKSNEDKCVLS